ncbi:MAG: helix-turn-helix domain-containing protein [Planctomycetes bacterium]|nr:helix-turn-helix domain-containing protein [Planctomycetota bacterium]
MASRSYDIDWDEALRLHEQEKWTHTEIAREFGYSPRTVGRELNKRGASRPPPEPRGKHAIELHAVWRNTHRKCEKPRHASYARFGAQGVRVCEAWKKFGPFYAWARKSGYRKGLRLARVDESAAFGPFNCRWATMAETLRARRPFRRKTKSAKPRVQIDWPEAERLLLEERLSQPEVARRLHASYTAIVAGFKRRGVRREKEPTPNSTPEGRRLYALWWSLHARCENPKARGYEYNGARGIAVAKEWAAFDAFSRWAGESGTQQGLWLTRVDDSKDYSPKNCIWAAREEVLRKRKPPPHPPRARRPIKALGETKALLAWSRDPRCPVTAGTIARRLDHGWDAKSAITSPAQFPGCSGLTFTELRAFGEVKGPAAWARDKRCRVTISGLIDRLRRGWSVAEAISTPPFRSRRDREPGPASNRRTTNRTRASAGRG